MFPACLVFHQGLQAPFRGLFHLFYLLPFSLITVFYRFLRAIIFFLVRFLFLCYSMSTSMLTCFFGATAMATSSTKSFVPSPAEKQVILQAMDQYESSLNRAVKAAKDKLIADAYESAAASARALRAKIESGELEF